MKKTLTEKLISYFSQDKEKTLDDFIKDHPDHKNSTYTLTARLEKRGLLKKQSFSHTTGLKNFFTLSTEGERVKQSLAEKETSRQRPAWDGFWRLLVFDVPEEEKALRDYLRNELKKRDFYMIQYSVWATPYPVDEELKQIIQEIGVKYYVRFMVIKEIDKQNDLLKHFGL